MGTRVTIGSDRTLRLNGRRFFPVGARHMPYGADFAALRDAGFNCLRWPVAGMDHNRLSGWSLPPADMEGLLVNPYLFACAEIAGEATAKRAELQALIGELRDHPALLCYEQRNEPSWHWGDFARPKSSPEALAAGSAIIREADPRHPIRIGHGSCNLTSTLRKYNAAADIVGCNPYPLNAPASRINCATRFDGRSVDSPNQTLSSVGEYTTRMMRAGEGRPVWMQLQAMPNENWHSGHYTPGLRDQGYYESDRLYPTRWQMRFMAYNAIVRGATALEWALFGIRTDTSHWLNVRAVIGELSALGDVLAAPTWAGKLQAEYEELGFGDWSGVETLVKRHDGKLWILAVNTQFDPAQAVLSGLPDGLRSLRVCGEDRTVPVSSGAFADRFQPYEAHVYVAEAELSAESVT